MWRGWRLTLRQGSIDEELFDVISGFEALFLEAVIKKQEAAVEARKAETQLRWLIQRDRV
ncbi:MAG: hypothetical protein ABL861_01410 [Nitrosomonas sp.]